MFFHFSHLRRVRNEAAAFYCFSSNDIFPGEQSTCKWNMARLDLGYTYGTCHNLDRQVKTQVGFDGQWQYRAETAVICSNIQCL